MQHSTDPTTPAGNAPAYGRATSEAQTPAGNAPADGETPAFEPTEPQLAAAADTFALLGSTARLHLVWLMSHGSHDVGALAERVGLSLPTTSQHLGRLRLAGIVSATKQGRHSYYSVEDTHVVELVEQIFQHIAPDGTLAPDPEA